ncbi:CPBP family intramembrane glutamic endopeptidase [Anaerosacchariphilus polymeriproducens]|uniref:CPBP family intramembrane metalloprotease n=1 Tax=Anaerosacchariphilus polymeriproducens TaxID=1812858 RepID=A0A371B078_9FIRM|nr:type II CAAX endopeptidase family protein [Anaerosacchariphilus polymeriproducens]RDU25211.1 CPBP family intramembrane metalloprotease [Anaerosacchariphilus polymeriproducens]
MDIIKKLKPLWQILLIAVFMVSYDLIAMAVDFSVFKLIPNNWIEVHGEWIACLISVFQIVFLLVLYKKWVKRQETPQITFSLVEGVWKSLLIGFGIAGIIFIWNVLVNLLMSNSSMVKSSMDLMEQADKQATNGYYLVELLFVGILAPIAEELLLRGVVFNTLERIYKKPWFAIVISSLIFGIWHGNFVQGVYTFVMALVVSFVYYKTRTLKWTMLIHIVINSSTMLPPGIDTGMNQTIVNVVSLVMIIPMMYIIYRMEKKSKHLLQDMQTVS